MLFLIAPTRQTDELDRWQAEARNVTIVRDDWGIAHVHGKTDADAVFGMIYAQAEDDFNRIETNYLTSLGRLAEAEGERAIAQDLRARLIADPVALQREYAASPPRLRALMDAWADGLNYFLATHYTVHPRVLRRFEPWMALSFTEGSIGGDIERASLEKLNAFYGNPLADPPGSNGIAIAPANTVDHHALLLINPHTSFYFRSELQMSSDEGLDAYGAVTWGQFFIYQGFNRHIGWMHTSTGADNVDFFAETIARRGGKLYYRYGSQWRPVLTSAVTVRYRLGDGRIAHKTFTVYRTHHGPIVEKQDGKWIAMALMNEPVAALSQSFYRTGTHDYASFLKIADTYKANSSNNTIFADDKGEIAFLMPQFIPVRDNRFDYSNIVDGSNPATDWKGLTPLERMPNVVNPRIGWVRNSNDTPYTTAGAESPRAADYPRYMDVAGENMRGIHATMLLTGRHDFTLEGLMHAAFDSYLPAFGGLIPSLLSAYDALPSGDSRRAELADPVATLRSWNDRWSSTSVATTVAIYWAEALGAEHVARHPKTLAALYDTLMHTSPDEKLDALGRAQARLTADFGHWNVPWGSVNRFQRVTDDIQPRFDDAEPSIPVPFTSGIWGSLAAFYTVQGGAKKRYGVSGNSFVAVIEFGKRIRARAITAGGESGNPRSPHFDDEAARYAGGNLREVYFYADQLIGHTERRYHPGD